jgi:hypothetical protein
MLRQRVFPNRLKRAHNFRADRDAGNARGLGLRLGASRAGVLQTSPSQKTLEQFIGGVRILRLFTRGWKLNFKQGVVVVPIGGRCYHCPGMISPLGRENHNFLSGVSAAPANRIRASKELQRAVEHVFYHFGRIIESWPRTRPLDAFIFPASFSGKWLFHLAQKIIVVAVQHRHGQHYIPACQEKLAYTTGRGHNATIPIPVRIKPKTKSQYAGTWNAL